MDHEWLFWDNRDLIKHIDLVKSSGALT